ncbi:flocculation FLO11-like protein [Labeo rohita]|uniref:Flocculation FLO11-like protein n=1 Tax=Labeo rohita TaxID=84645 RepID=A0A498LN05_LABRO|nr:flocculation FLO11-like protein [Labeo rohita]
MRTQSAFIIWTAMVLHVSVIKASTASSPSVSYLKSTISYSETTTAPATSISPSEGPQTVSTSARNVTQTTQTAPSFTITYPQTSQVTLTSSSKVTGPAPLEKDQDEPSELDVGDQGFARGVSIQNSTGFKTCLWMIS